MKAEKVSVHNIYIKNTTTRLSPSSSVFLYVFRVCGCVCVGGGGGMSAGDVRQPSPVICKSHEL